MYYLFKEGLIDWHDTFLAAKVIEQPALEDQKIWNLGKSLTNQNPQFVFSMPKGAPLFDNQDTGGEYALYSSKLMTILRTTGIKFETFPAKLVTDDDNQEIDLKYEVFRLLEISDCIDQEKTSFVVLDIGQRQIKVIAQPVYTSAFLKSGILLTRIAGFERDVVIHEDLKKIMEDAGITGCDFSLRQLDSSILGDTA